MRKESLQIAKAFIARKPKKERRTETDGVSIYLHGNRIAWWGKAGDLYMTLAGWDTVTTRERLNTLCSLLRRADAKGFRRASYKPYFGSVPIGPRTIVRLKAVEAL